MDRSRLANDASPLLNVPNQLTIARLVLSIVCFVFLAFNWYLTGAGRCS